MNCCHLLKSNIKNSFELKKKLNSVNIPEDLVLVSLDITSLFSNVSKKLVMEALERRFNNLHLKPKDPFQDIKDITAFILLLTRVQAPCDLKRTNPLRSYCKFNQSKIVA